MKTILSPALEKKSSKPVDTIIKFDEKTQQIITGNIIDRFKLHIVGYLSPSWKTQMIKDSIHQASCAATRNIVWNKQNYKLPNRIFTLLGWEDIKTITKLQEKWQVRKLGNIKKYYENLKIPISTYHIEELDRTLPTLDRVEQRIKIGVKYTIDRKYSEKKLDYDTEQLQSALVDITKPSIKRLPPLRKEDHRPVFLFPLYRDRHFECKTPYNPLDTRLSPISTQSSPTDSLYYTPPTTPHSDEHHMATNDPSSKLQSPSEEIPSEMPLNVLKKDLVSGTTQAVIHPTPSAKTETPPTTTDDPSSNPSSNPSSESSVPAEPSSEPSEPVDPSNDPGRDPGRDPSEPVDPSSVSSEFSVPAEPSSEPSEPVEPSNEPVESSSKLQPPPIEDYSEDIYSEITEDFTIPKDVTPSTQPTSEKQAPIPKTTTITPEHYIAESNNDLYTRLLPRHTPKIQEDPIIAEELITESTTPQPPVHSPKIKKKENKKPQTILEQAMSHITDFTLDKNITSDNKKTVLGFFKQSLSDLYDNAVAVNKSTTPKHFDEQLYNATSELTSYLPIYIQYISKQTINNHQSELEAVFAEVQKQIQQGSTSNITQDLSSTNPINHTTKNIIQTLLAIKFTELFIKSAKEFATNKEANSNEQIPKHIKAIFDTLAEKVKYSVLSDLVSTHETNLNNLKRIISPLSLFASSLGNNASKKINTIIKFDAATQQIKKGPLLDRLKVFVTSIFAKQKTEKLIQKSVDKACFEAAKYEVQNQLKDLPDNFITLKSTDSSPTSLHTVAERIRTIITHNTNHLARIQDINIPRTTPVTLRRLSRSKQDYDEIPLTKQDDTTEQLHSALLMSPSSTPQAQNTNPITASAQEYKPED